MLKARDRDEIIIADLKEKIGLKRGALIIAINGITVEADTKLRMLCRENNAIYSVCRSSVAYKAMSELDFPVDEATGERNAYIFFESETFLEIFAKTLNMLKLGEMVIYSCFGNEKGVYSKYASLEMDEGDLLEIRRKEKENSCVIKFKGTADKIKLGPAILAVKTLTGMSLGEAKQTVTDLSDIRLNQAEDDDVHDFINVMALYGYILEIEK